MEKLSAIRKHGQQEIWKEFDRMSAQTLTCILETFMEEERNRVLQCTRHQRSDGRQGYRNGYESRWLETRKGRLRLRIPRVRNTEQPLRTLVFNAYQRRSRDIEEAVEQWVAAGQSTRSIEDSLMRSFDCMFSATTVSRVIAKVDAEMETFHQRDLSHSYRLIFFDAKHGYVCRTRKNGRRGKKKKGVLLACWGLRHDGAEELVDFSACEGGESEKNWTAFLTRLERRGLRRRNRWEQLLELLVTDGDGGLEAAMLTVYPHVPKQRCVFHKIQNLSSHLQERKNRKAILASAKEIYQNLKTPQEAAARMRAWAARWQAVEPEAVKNFRTDFKQTLRYLNLPPELWSRCRTTNPIERFNLELERASGHVCGWQNLKSWERRVFIIWRRLKASGYAPIKPNPDFTRSS